MDVAKLPSLDEQVSDPDMRAIKAFKAKEGDAVKGVLLRYTGEPKRELWLGASKLLADWTSGKPYINPKSPKAVYSALRGIGEGHMSGGEPQPKPPELKQRFKEVGLAKDKKGYFVYTHRSRSASYPSPEKIPLDKVKFIASTG